MLAIISILIIGLVVGFMMLIAASMLSSQISSTETDYLAEASSKQQHDPDGSSGNILP